MPCRTWCLLAFPKRCPRMLSCRAMATSNKLQISCWVEHNHSHRTLRDKMRIREAVVRPQDSVAAPAVELMPSSKLPCKPVCSSNRSTLQLAWMQVTSPTDKVTWASPSFSRSSHKVSSRKARMIATTSPLLAWISAYERKINLPDFATSEIHVTSTRCCKFTIPCPVS